MDILGRQLTNYGGSFSSDDALATFPNLPGAAAYMPAILLQIGMQYQQQISRFYGLNRNAVFLVGGRTNGAANMSQILVPGNSQADFFSVYGNVCRAKGNLIRLSLKTGCQTDGSQKTVDLTAGMCIINSISLQTESETATVSNGYQMSYESLEYVEG